MKDQDFVTELKYLLLLPYGMDDHRGQSTVIGFILLLGLSMVVIGGTVVMGEAAISDRSTQFDSGNAENSISNVESEMSAVSIGSASSRNVGLSQTADGIYHVDPDAGSVTITHTVSGSEKWNVTRDLGAVIYNGSDKDVAYQGGGVWMKQGNFTDVVSSPEYHYRDSALTFPIIQILNPQSGSVEYGDVTSGTTLESDELDYPLEKGTVTVTVHSQYYRGWHEFFKDRTDGTATLHHNNKTTTTELVVPDELTLDNALSLEATYDSGNGNGKKQVVPTDELEDNVPHASADSLISQEVSTASSDNDNSAVSCMSTSGVTSDCTLDSGTYYFDSSVYLNHDLTLDVSSGDITIATDGDFDIGSNSVSVIGDADNTVKYYVNGSLRGQGNGAITHASGSDPTQNQLFVADGFLDDSVGGGTVDYEAVIYAPDADVETGGNFAIRGALIAYDLDVNGNAGDISRGGVPEDFVLDITGTSDTIKFLHVTTNRVTAEIQASDLSVAKHTPSTSNDCDWVESQINSGDLSMSNEKAQCDVDAGLDDTVTNVDFDTESVLLGNIDVTGDVDLDTSHVVGRITTSGQDITITSDSIVTGDVVAPSGTQTDIDGGSRVEGAVVAHDGSLSVSSATITGHIYANEDNYSCSDMTIGPNEKSCSEYDIRNPDDY